MDLGVFWAWLANYANQAPSSEVSGPRQRCKLTDGFAKTGLVADERAEFIRLVNIGKAQFENRSFDKTVEDLATIS